MDKEHLNSKDVYTVKLTPYRKKFGTILHRQSKEHACFSSDGRYRFIMDDALEEADFWVVHGKGVKISERCRVSRQNTILLTTEPDTIFVYPKSYLKQFGLVHSCQTRTKHPHIIYGPAIIPWFVGYTERNNKKGYDKEESGINYTLDYDQLKNSDFPTKTKLISVVTSNKVTSQGHLDRIRFVEKLKKHYGDQIDVFGRGIKDFDDKWDVLAPYQYHIALENNATDYYWTEKLADCYLSGTFPIYYGCQNINNYFPKGSYRPINIKNFDESIKIIDEIIANDTFNNSRELLKECKNSILEEYNIFNYVAKLCDTLNPKAPKEEVIIKPCVSIKNWKNIKHYVFERTYFQWKGKFFNLLEKKL